jgi:uncharacterized membrane protein/protein-disulfide isomerase
MASDNNSMQIKNLWPWWRWLITGLNALALFLSAVLSWHFLKGGTMIGCGGGSPCDVVLSSRWSVVAGIIPVSGLAMGAYLAMLFAGFFIGQDTDNSIRRLAWITMLAIAGSVIGSAIWFTILQKWFIGKFCPYCMTEHLTGLILSVLIIWHAKKESFSTDPFNKKNKSGVSDRTGQPLPVLLTTSAGLLIAGLLVVMQFSFSPPKYLDGNSQNNVAPKDYKNVPIIGSPDAPYVVNLLFDYKCPHCQRLHFMLSEAVQRYAGKLAFVICPAPLNPSCNPYIPKEVEEYKNSCELAKIGMAVWLAGRDVFPDFENWMFTFESGDLWRPRSLEAAKAKAIEMVGQEKFEKAINDQWIDKYIQTSVSIYGQTIKDGKGGVPRLVYGSRWVIPQPYDVDELMTILQNSLAIPAP